MTPAKLKNNAMFSSEDARLMSPTPDFKSPAQTDFWRYHHEQIFSTTKRIRRNTIRVRGEKYFESIYSSLWFNGPGDHLTGLWGRCIFLVERSLSQYPSSPPTFTHWRAAGRIDILPRLSVAIFLMKRLIRLEMLVTSLQFQLSGDPNS